ncbi:MAG: hypothetical protein MR636_08940 [Clostridiales bacterium]|nr:hypothetical protein [Clostridiales bacterium]
MKKPGIMTILGFLGGTPEGTRSIMVSASSSRRRADVRRAFAFYGSSPQCENNPNPSPTEIRFGLLTLGTPEGTRTPDLLIRRCGVIVFNRILTFLKLVFYSLSYIFYQLFLKYHFVPLRHFVRQKCAKFSGAQK